MVRASDYIPEIVKTPQSQHRFIVEQTRNSKVIQSPPQPQASWVEFRVSIDTNNRLWLYAVDTQLNELDYLMHLNPLRFTFDSAVDSQIVSQFNAFSIYQGSVWRSARALETLGQTFVADVFWKLSQRKNWFSDSVQSQAGKAFWERRLHEAKIRGYSAYACHFSETGSKVKVTEVVPLAKDTSLQKYWTYEVNKDDSGLNWRFAIAHKRKS
jgi:hypothetical protein